MAAVFGQPTPDENLVPGWNSQSSPAAPGYAQAGVAPATTTVSTASQASAGYPSPAGAENASNAENSGSQSVSILTNPGYADGNTLLTVTSTTPALTTVGVQNPYGVNAALQVTTTTAATTAQVAPYAASAAAATFGAAQTVIVGVTVLTVPPAGWVKVALATNITGVVWTPVN